MGMTNEKIDVEIKIKCSYTYLGEEIGFSEKENIAKNIKEDLLQKLFEIVEWECNYNRENLDVINEEVETLIDNKNFGF